MIDTPCTTTSDVSDTKPESRRINGTLEFTSWRLGLSSLATTLVVFPIAVPFHEFVSRWTAHCARSRIESGRPARLLRERIRILAADQDDTECIRE